jgi:glucose/arabinose dehydrogenase
MRSARILSNLLVPLGVGLGWTALGCSCAPAAPLDPTCILMSEGFGPKGTTSVKVEVVATGLEVPWGIAFLPGGDMLITERPGRIRAIRGGKLTGTIAELAVTTDNESGLLGIAAHPDFASNKLFYVYMTVEENDERWNRVVRMRLADDGNSAAQDKVIIDRIPGEKYHDGGRLRFGPDGMLYVGTGDAREPDTSQDTNNLAGKILRVTPDGDVPADNPLPGKRAFLIGIRNTQGFDWFDDKKTMAVTDHGPSGDTVRWGHDEVNVATAGQNLGWPTIYSCETQPGMVTPELTWDDAAPPGGAAFYRGDAIPEWKGSLLIGTLKSKHLHLVAFDPNTPGKVVKHEVYFEGDPPNGHGRLRDVIMGPDGALYVTTSNCDGRGECPSDKDKILRITR